MARKQVVLVTGVRSGLGAAIARHLVLKGHIVYGTSRHDVLSDSEGYHLLKLDVASEEQCRNVIGEIMLREKQIDVIVNNAGITLSGPTLQFSAEDFKHILDTNLVGSFRLLKEAFSFSSKPKLVINITSLNGFLSFPNYGLYSASKFAMEAMGLALRYELASSTKVVNVAPGALMAKTTKALSHKTAREKSPLLRWLLPLTDPNDVARVIDKLINASSVPARVLIGRDAHIINVMQKVLPLSVFDRIVSYIWNKK